MAYTETEIDQFMQAAIAEANQARIIGEVPIGAVIVQNGEIIGRGHNIREHAQDATLHAEMLAIQEACMVTKSWRLEEAAIFVTLEPCPMCAGAIINSRIPNVYFGASDPKAGVTGTLMNLLTDTRFNHQAQVIGGIREAECAALLQTFFKAIRAKRRLKKKNASNLKSNQL